MLSGWLVIGLLLLVAISPTAFTAVAVWAGWDLATLEPAQLWRPTGFASAFECLELRERVEPFSLGHLAASYIVFVVATLACVILGLVLGVQAIARGFRVPSASVSSLRRGIGILIIGAAVLGYGLDMWYSGGLMSFWLCEHNDSRFWMLSLLLAPLALGFFSIFVLMLFAMMPVIARALFRLMTR
jgi:hypothetical protein